MSSKKYQLVLESSMDELPRAEEFILNVAGEAGLDNTATNNLVLAVNEAAVNAMVHGNKLSKDKKISIDVLIEDKLFQISIKDQGAGFRPESVPDPTNPENLFKESGRGLYIMKSCIHEMKYNFTPEGTELILKILL